MHKTEKEAEESRMKFMYSYLRDITLAKQTNDGGPGDAKFLGNLLLGKLAVVIEPGDLRQSVLFIEKGCARSDVFVVLTP
jgi:hypothetical protein